MGWRLPSVSDRYPAHGTRTAVSKGVKRVDAVNDLGNKDL